MARPVASSHHFQPLRSPYRVFDFRNRPHYPFPRADSPVNKVGLISSQEMEILNERTIGEHGTMRNVAITISILRS